MKVKYIKVNLSQFLFEFDGANDDRPSNRVLHRDHVRVDVINRQYLKIILIKKPFCMF